MASTASIAPMKSRRPIASGIVPDPMSEAIQQSLGPDTGPLKGSEGMLVSWPCPYQG